MCLAATDVVAHPFQILLCRHRGLSHLGDRRHMLSHHSKIWQLAQTIIRAPLLHAHTPLWDNLCLPELMTIPDHRLWIAQRIIYLSQFIKDGAIKPFHALKVEFDLPNRMLFRYIQVRHALQSQFCTSIPQLESTNLAGVILGVDPKKLISALYNLLLAPRATTHAYQLKSRWEDAVGEIEDEQ